MLEEPESILARSEKRKFTNNPQGDYLAITYTWNDLPWYLLYLNFEGKYLTLRLKMYWNWYWLRTCSFNMLSFIQFIKLKFFEYSSRHEGALSLYTHRPQSFLILWWKKSGIDNIMLVVRKVNWQPRVIRLMWKSWYENLLLYFLPAS